MHEKKANNRDVQITNLDNYLSSSERISIAEARIEDLKSQLTSAEIVLSQVRKEEIAGYLGHLGLLRNKKVLERGNLIYTDAPTEVVDGQIDEIDQRLHAASIEHASADNYLPSPEEN